LLVLEVVRDYASRSQAGHNVSPCITLREIQYRQVSIREKRLYQMVRYIHDPQ